MHCLYRCTIYKAFPSWEDLEWLVSIWILNISYVEFPHLFHTMDISHNWRGNHSRQNSLFFFHAFCLRLFRKICSIKLNICKQLTHLPANVFNSFWGVLFLVSVYETNSVRSLHGHTDWILQIRWVNVSVIGTSTTLLTWSTILLADNLLNHVCWSCRKSIELFAVLSNLSVAEPDFIAAFGHTLEVHISSKIPQNDLPVIYQTKSLKNLLSKS